MVYYYNNILTKIIVEKIKVIIFGKLLVKYNKIIMMVSFSIIVASGVRVVCMRKKATVNSDDEQKRKNKSFR